MTILKMVSTDALSNNTTTHSFNPKYYLCRVSPLRLMPYVMKAGIVPRPIVVVEYEIVVIVEYRRTRTGEECRRRQL